MYFIASSLFEWVASKTNGARGKRQPRAESWGGASIRSTPRIKCCLRLRERDADLGEGACGNGIRHAEHAKQHVFVAHRPFGCTVERIGERHLQPSADAYAAGACALERARPECLLHAVAYRLEIDSQHRQRLRVDPRVRTTTVFQPAGKLSLDRVGGYADARKQPHGRAVGVADEDAEDVFGTGVVVAEPPRLLRGREQVPLGRPDRLHPRWTPGTLEQSHRVLRRRPASRVPYFWCTACLDTPSSSAICCQLQPSSRACRTCNSSTAS